MATIAAAPAIKMQITCEHCKKTMLEDNFYTYKNGKKDCQCKTCRTMHINNWEPDTFTPLLQLFDVPYVEAEWNVLRDRAYAKDPKKMTPMSVFGKYLSKMRLKNWQKYSWADTERFAQEAEEKKIEIERAKKIRLAEIEKDFQEGVITKEQYDSYLRAEAPEEQFEVGLAPGGGTEIYSAGSAPFEKVELADVGSDLTNEDKVYLAMKWGQLYTAAEWVSLEQKYNEFKESFDIQDAAREDQLLFICKTSLKMHQALDAGDVDSYQKLSKVYDSQMKAAKFTEAQKKEEKAGEFDAIGQIIFYCESEKGGGFIPEWEEDLDLDIADKVLKNLKDWNQDLIKEDPTVFKQVEAFIKKREILAEQEADLQYALENNDGIIELTDEDFKELRDAEASLSLEDRESLKEDSE